MNVYVTGAAGIQMQVDLLKEVAELLGAHADPDTAAVIAHPVPTATSAERLTFAASADVVVLVRGWEADRLARHDAQVAVWAGRKILHDYGLRKPGTNGGPVLPIMTELPHEKVQDILDRGLRVSMFEDTAAVDLKKEGEG